ncbi:hypothetical protein Bbelb_204460 [Branchiostoma belcheri]|nr:hypothetical protein Bbelb_204460 [Branchiostoma belcheri]
MHTQGYRDTPGNLLERELNSTLSLRPRLECSFIQLWAAHPSIRFSLCRAALEQDVLSRQTLHQGGNRHVLSLSANLHRAAKIYSLETGSLKKRKAIVVTIDPRTWVTSVLNTALKCTLRLSFLLPRLLPAKS